eukprot:7288825-Alexandrium_andersonii.AAC.1
MATSTRPNFRRASRQNFRPLRISQSRRTSTTATGLHTRGRTSSQCDGFPFRRLQYSPAADLSQRASRSANPARTWSSRPLQPASRS